MASFFLSLLPYIDYVHVCSVECKYFNCTESEGHCFMQIIVVLLGFCDVPSDPLELIHLSECLCLHASMELKPLGSTWPLNLVGL